LVEPGGFEPQFFLRIDLQSPALLGLRPLVACIVAALVSSDFDTFSTLPFLIVLV